MIQKNNYHRHRFTLTTCLTSLRDSKVFTTLFFSNRFSNSNTVSDKATNPQVQQNCQQRRLAASTQRQNNIKSNKDPYFRDVDPSLQRRLHQANSTVM